LKGSLDDVWIVEEKEVITPVSRLSSRHVIANASRPIVQSKLYVLDLSKDRQCFIENHQYAPMGTVDVVIHH